MKSERKKLVRAVASLLICAVALLCGCGSDDSGTGESNGTVVNNGSPHEDASSDAASDAGSDAAASDAIAQDAGSDVSDQSGYDPALADLGQPPTSCPTTLVNAGADTGSARARIFVPNYRVDFSVLSSHQVFREHIHELVHEKVLSCRPDGIPTVVVFPESMGLPMLLIGDKAAAARQMTESTQALTAMVGHVQQAFTYYAEKFPGSSITNRFLLAMTDTVVRATYDTFGQIADRYDIYVSVTVDLPEFQKTTDPEIVGKLADPDYDTHDYAYEAISAEVHNRQILFGPDGEVVDETLKTYVTGVELDQLALAPGDFTQIHPMDTPWGKTGVVISKPAWMPDVQDRLDDLGAEVIFQPEAFIGGWIKPVAEDTPEAQVRWEPDLFMLGGWNLVQRAARATHNFVPQLTGNFFELPADGQVQFIEEASRGAGSDAFVGQHGPLAGNTFIGPWVVEDPGAADASLTLAERRTQLRQVGKKLLPGSGDATEGDYVEGMWAADLYGAPVDDPVEVQTHPELAVVDGTVFVASSKGAVGSRALTIEVYENGSLAGSYQQQVPGYDLVRPSIAVGAEKVHVVSELIGDGENRLAYTAFDPARDAFVGSAHVIDSPLVGEWAFHPAIAVSGNVLHMSWIKRVGNANRAFYAQTSLSDPFAALAVNSEIEPRPDDRPELNANQWDARVAVDSQAIAVTWLDFKNWQWEVMVAVSTDGGLNWSDPQRVDAVPTGVEAINSSPTIEALGESRFLVAWTDARATRPNTRIGARTFTVASGGAIALDDALLIGQSAPYDTWMWRPTIAVEAAGPTIAYETLDGESWSLEQVTIDADGALGAPTTLVEASAPAKHFATSAATPSGVVVAFEEVSLYAGTASKVRVQAP